MIRFVSLTMELGTAIAILAMQCATGGAKMIMFAVPDWKKIKPPTPSSEGVGGFFCQYFCLRLRDLFGEAILNIVEYFGHQMQSVLASYIMRVHGVGEEIHLNALAYELLNERQIVLHNLDVINGSMDKQ